MVRNSDNEYIRLKIAETSFNVGLILAKTLLKIPENNNKMNEKANASLLNKILSFLNKKGLNKIAKCIKNSKLINFVVNLADNYLSVCVKKLEFSFLCHK